MKKQLFTVGLLLIAFLILLLNLIIKNFNWVFISFLIVIIVIGIAFTGFEKGHADPKKIAMIATLSSIAGISRIPFTVIMSFQPTTFIVMISGYVFGSRAGFVIGAVAALVSNFFLGQGPWTPWQMVCWGGCGMVAGLLSNKSRGFNNLLFVPVCGFSGYFYGWVMNIWHWVGFVYPLTIKTFLATYIASFPFDTIHAIGNVLFTILFGKSFYLILMRFKRRMTVIEDNNKY